MPVPGFLSKLWPLLLAVYIISPFDAHPLFLDDLIASGVLFYVLFKNAKKKNQQNHEYFGQSGPGSQTKGNSSAESTGPLTLDRAYTILGVSPKASLDEISKAYKEKVMKSHPDKVSHLSRELQEKAKEITLNLNGAYGLIKKHRK